MSTIGLLDLIMRAPAGPFVKDINQGRKAISDIKNEAASAGDSFGGLSGGMTKFGGVIAGIGAAIGAGALVAGFKAFVEESGKSVVATARLSDRLGVSTEAIIGLQHAASQSLGADKVEAFTDSLSDMQEKLGDITLEEGGAKDIVKILGLDAAKLATQDAVTNFKQIADAMGNVKSKAEKLHIADTLFGGSGQALLPLLEQGSAGVNKFAAEAEKLGLTFSRVDAAKVEAANAAMGRVGAVIQGIGQELAIGLAPYIEAAANSLTNLGAQGLDVGSWITAGMKIAAQGIGVVADVIHTVGIGWKLLQAITATVIDGIMVGVNNLGNGWHAMAGAGATAFSAVLSVLAKVGEGIEWLINKIPGVKVKFGSTLKDMAKDAKKFADESFAKIELKDSGLGSFADDAWKDFNDSLMAAPPSEGINNFFNDIESGAQKAAQAIADAKKPMDELGGSFTAAAMKIGELEDKLREQIATYGMSGSEVEIYKLKALGATEEQLKSVRKLSDALKAKSIIESNMTPIEKYKKELAELQRLAESGAIDGETFNRAKNKLAKDSGLNPENKFASAMELGSNEARQTLLRHSGLGKQDPNLQVEKNTAVIADESKKQTTKLESIEKKLAADEEFSFN